MSAPQVSAPAWRLDCPAGHSLTVQHVMQGVWAIGWDHPRCDWCARAFERLEKLCDRTPDESVAFLLELVVKAGDIGHE